MKPFIQSMGTESINSVVYFLKYVVSVNLPFYLFYPYNFASLCIEPEHRNWTYDFQKNQLKTLYHCIYPLAHSHVNQFGDHFKET